MTDVIITNSDVCTLNESCEHSKALSEGSSDFLQVPLNISKYLIYAVIIVELKAGKSRCSWDNFIVNWSNAISISVEENEWLKRASKGIWIKISNPIVAYWKNQKTSKDIEGIDG